MVTVDNDLSDNISHLIRINLDGLTPENRRLVKTNTESSRSSLANVLSRRLRNVLIELNFMFYFNFRPKFCSKSNMQIQSFNSSRNCVKILKVQKIASNFQQAFQRTKRMRTSLPAVQDSFRNYM